MSVPSEIAKIVAKNILKKKQLQSAAKKITSKDVKEVYREAKKNPGGARKVPTLSKPRTARTGPLAQKTSSGGYKVTTLGGRKGKKPDTRVTSKRILSEEKPTRSRKVGPIESGILSPAGLRRPLGSAKKPEKTYTPAQARALLKREARANREIAKREATSQRRSVRRGDTAGVRSARESVKAHKEDNRFSRPTIDSRTKPRPAELTPREVAILRKVGKRDYSRGEVNTLAQRTVQGEADRRVEQGLRNKKARNDVQNEITRIENRIAEAQRVRRNAERVRRLEADKRALQAFLNSRKKGK